MKAVPPAHARCDDLGNRDVAFIGRNDANSPEPDAQVEVPGFGAVAFLEEVTYVGRFLRLVNVRIRPPSSPRPESPLRRWPFAVSAAARTPRAVLPVHLGSVAMTAVAIAVSDFGTSRASWRLRSGPPSTRRSNVLR